MAQPISPPRTTRGSPPAGRHASSTAPATTTATTTSTATITTTNTPLGFQRPPDRLNLSIAPTSSNTSSPQYSTTSSPPPVSPGIVHPVGSSFGTMGPTTTRHETRPSALTFEMTPTSTPTGRISKAKKGKRVHACEFPGCNKIFTRAEHRRRHELNHNPDATYRCSQPGCGKSFHRIDLLQRHQERHDLEAPTETSVHRRYPSQSSVLSEPPVALPATSMPTPQPNEAVPRTSAGRLPITSLVNPHSYAADSTGAFSINHMPAYYPYYNAPEDGLFYVPDHGQSPVSSAYHPRSDMSATSSVNGYDTTSQSPMVTASIPAPVYMTPESAPPNVIHPMFEPNMSPYPSSATGSAMLIPLSDLDGREWDLIGRELSTVPGLLSSPNRDGIPDTLRWHCLDLYWQCFHPTYPIVHRPTFLTGTKPPPLLACAMVAIGSYYDTRADAKKYSLALLEIATKILRGREGITCRSRIDDLQTVVLLEILSTFCARQISVQMSAKFRALFANLSTNIDSSKSALTTKPLAVFRTLGQHRNPAELQKAQRVWIECETRSRILHACSVLDAQQTTLFDQPLTVRRHASLRVDTSSVHKKLNLPCDDELWDASPIERWAQVAEKHEYVQLIGGKPIKPPGRESEFSYFQQEVINANTEAPLKSTLDRGKIISITGEQTFNKTAFNYHAMEMCHHTPIRHLLVVTGESWVLGKKVEKRADYDRAKGELRKWLESSAPSKKGFPESIVAHWHALKLLRSLEIQDPHSAALGDIFGTTNMLHENWAIYIASLVCWAHGHRRSGSSPSTYRMGRSSGSHGLVNHTNLNMNGVSGHETMSSPSCLDPIRAAQEAETYLIFTNVSAATALKDLEPAVLGRTQGLLESVRSQKIAKHMMGGLMNDAEQVLLKLIEGKKSITF